MFRRILLLAESVEVLAVPVAALDDTAMAVRDALDGAVGSLDVEGAGGLHRDAPGMDALPLSHVRSLARWHPSGNSGRISPPASARREGNPNRFARVREYDPRPIALISSTGWSRPESACVFPTQAASKACVFGIPSRVRLNFVRAPEKLETGKPVQRSPSNTGRDVWR
ncbi:MAG: hypothetical protein OXI87_15815 [Albidovulum sp.]|nr:hypothetical protein [Albidovulum sp.]